MQSWGKSDTRIKTRIWKVIRIVIRNYKKFQESNILFSNWSFFLVIFLCVSSVLSAFLSVSSVFLLLFFIRTFGYHWNNKVAEDTYLISIQCVEYLYNYNCDIMAKSRYDTILNFRHFIKLFGVLQESPFPLLPHKTTFASLRYLYLNKTQTSLWRCWMILLRPSICSQKLTDLTCALSQ